MPKLFGLNLVGVLVASVVFYLIGWAWYGMIFMDAWMAEMNLPESASEEGMNPVLMILGFLITALQVIGIGLVLKWKGAADLAAAATTAGILWVVFGFPFSMYGYLYGPAHSTTLLMIDAGHLLVGWVVSAVILSFFK